MYKRDIVMVSMFPVRCFTCNKVIDPYYETYKNMRDGKILKEEKKPAGKKSSGKKPAGKKSSGKKPVEDLEEMVADMRLETARAYSTDEIWEKLGIRRDCCKTIFLTHHEQPMIDYDVESPHIKLYKDSQVTRIYKAI
jgi:DNA-directed RNA polymerase subunit N (RpoN/RPB10)